MQILRSIFAVLAGLVLISVIVEPLEFGSLRMGSDDSRASAIDSGLDVGLFDRYDICRSHDWLTAPTTPHAG